MNAIVNQVSWNSGGGQGGVLLCTTIPVWLVQRCPTFEKEVGVFI